LKIGSPDLLAQGRGAELQALIREAYRRIGLDVTFMELPTLRELEWADLGEVDGCLVRTTMVAERFPHLVRVRFPLLQHCLAACSLAEGADVQGPGDLQGLRVGACRGSLGTIGYLRQQGITPVLFNDSAAALRALGERRIDTAVGVRLLLKMAAQEQMLQVRYSPSLHKWNFYHWLNREHADLAPRLARVLREMYGDGDTARLLGRYAWMLRGMEIEDEVREPVRPRARPLAGASRGVSAGGEARRPFDQSAGLSQENPR